MSTTDTKAKELYYGEVIFFNSQKGYGFLSMRGKKEEFFCHYSSIEMEGYKKLLQGQRVQYEIGPGPNGPQACHVKVVEK